MPAILCIGHCAWDINLALAGFPDEDDKVSVPSKRESGGGPAANAAYLLATWGVDCGFAGVVRDDDPGGRSLDELKLRGVDLSWAERRPGHATPVSIVLVNRVNGSRTILTHKVPTHGLSLPDAPSPAV